jgi:two-component system response regulator YesN
MKVVIVEDEIRIREGIEKLLSKLEEDYVVCGVAEDGESGLKIIRETKPDIVITDIRMPVMDGLEMLKALSEGGIKTKAVVLSAYSEFDYARTAMKLGVTEYILKPVSLTDFAQAMSHVREQVLIEKSRKPAEVGTIDQIIRDAIDGRFTLNDKVAEYLNDNYGIKADGDFILITAYLGKTFEKDSKRAFSVIKHILSLEKDIAYVAEEITYRKSIVILVYKWGDKKDLRHFFQNSILASNEVSMAVGWVECSGLDGIHEKYDLLNSYMDWNIAFGKNVLITYPNITGVKTDSCIYPAELEVAMRSAICSFDEAKIKKTVSAFHSTFRNGKVYIPKEIKECYVRFMWMMIGVAKEVGALKEDAVDQQKILTGIMDSKLTEELDNEVENLISNIRFKEDEYADVHLAVKKAISMVQEFYGTGITLEEISRKLSLTPEYLGMLFHKETGRQFSTYIKNYRVEKAKQLICGTNMKLYEISAKVGYADPKYFGKVFKEATGMLPTDYRKKMK